MRMPVLFSGHGSPLIALENNEITKEMRAVGERVVRECGKPKAILSLSAHWYTRRTFVQSKNPPKQIYDMFGFPKELYALKYPVKGFSPLTERVEEILREQVSVNDTWGIDHGTWSVLVHFFPKADIPVVQLSISRSLSPKESYELGKKLSILSEEGYLVFGSGNVVHNLYRVEWDNPDGSEATRAFNEEIVQAVLARDDQKILRYEKLKYASYAVPTPDHFLPLIYCLGASEGREAEVFNDVCNLGSIAITGFLWR